MIPICFKYNEYKIESITETDIKETYNWLMENNEEDYSCCDSLNFGEFYDRYLESYYTDNEVFIKICKENRLLGILKGRVEYYSKVELLIWLYIIKNEERNKGVGKEILDKVIENFNKNYKISKVNVFICDRNEKAQNFWEKQNFYEDRIVEKFFKDSKNNSNKLIILSKEIGH